MRIPEDKQALRIENLATARMNTMDLQPQKGLFHMSVISGGKKEEIFYSWPELKGNKFCKDYFAKQDFARNELTKKAEEDVNNIKKVYEEKTGKSFEEEEEETIILEGSGFAKELF